MFQPTLIALQAHTLKSRRAAVISNRNFFRCAGGACGLAISAAVLQAALRANLPVEYSYIAENTYAVPNLQGDGLDRVLDAYMAASRAVFILQVPLIGICFLGCVFIRDRGLEPIEDEIKEKSATGSSSDESKPPPPPPPQEPGRIEEGNAGALTEGSLRTELIDSRSIKS